MRALLAHSRRAPAEHVGTGHLSYAERPDVFSQTLLGFLSALDTAPAVTA